MDTGKIWGRNFILAMSLNGIVLAVFLAQASTVGLFARTLGATNVEIGVTATVATLSALCFRPIVGWMLDRQGRALTLAIGIVVLALGTFLTNWVQDLTWLYVFSALRGAAFAFTSTACITLATDAIPHTRLSEGFGYYSLAAILASAIGPSAGLAVVKDLGFPVFWLGTGTIVAVSLGLTFLLRSPHDAGLFEAKAEAVRNSERNVPVLREKLSLVSGILVPSSLNLLAFLAFSALMTFLPLLIVNRDIPNGGIYFTVQAAGTLLVRLFGSRLGERHGYRPMLLLFLPLMTASYVLIGLASSLPLLLVAAVAYGIGNGVAQPLYTATLIKECPPGQRGKANAFFMAASDIGLSIGAVLLGAVSTATGGFAAVYYTAAAVTLIQIAVVVFSKAIPGKSHVERG